MYEGLQNEEVITMIATALVDKRISRVGELLELHLDQGHIYKLRINVTTSLNPQSDGMVEIN